MIRVYEHGSDSLRPPVLIVHGLFGSGRNWSSVAKRLSAERRVLTLDMRNHGLSEWRDSHGYDALASDLAEVIGAFGGNADVLGHSMGGKASMAAALRHPEMVRRLVVADIAPVTYGHSHSHSHLIEAMRSVDLDAVRLRSDADAILRESIEDPGVRGFLLQSLELRGKRWQLNLDVLEAEMDRITGWPDSDAQTDHPTLFICGSDSDYVSGEGRARARKHFPAARFLEIQGTGHWLHAEKPMEFVASVRAFLNI